MFLLLKAWEHTPRASEGERVPSWRHNPWRMTERSTPTLLLDGDADQAAPFGPGAIVVAYCRIPEQVVQHEPGVTAAFTNATVGHHFFLGGNPFAFVQGTQFLRWFESAIFADGQRPGNVDRPRNVPSPLCAFLGQVRRGEQLPAIFTRRAYIHQRKSITPEGEQDLIAESADIAVGGVRGIAGAPVGRDLRG